MIRSWLTLIRKCKIGSVLGNVIDEMNCPSLRPAFTRRISKAMRSNVKVLDGFVVAEKK